MKTRTLILTIFLAVFASLHCLSWETKAEFRKFLDERVYGYWDVKNTKDKRIKKEVVPAVERLIDERNAFAKKSSIKEHDALVKERDALIKKHDTVVKECNALTKKNGDLSKENASLVQKNASKRGCKRIVALWTVAALAVGFFLGKIFPRFVSFASNLMSRKSKPVRNPSPHNSRENPNKCPQCGTIRPEGQNKCPNPKCGIRF